ncbi:IclR family transcriptional regulator domain-containing protein [Paeniglutamicibacter kerguelensis]|uniref:IclR family pca regulon transcriptional regulator n=1 Tax=Paeniglutamicibacter kerguelensis TaxID=254788 RepID=A0ABS4XHS8_9MICC|nr:IclR family transcriptional regulator C-terminal domain-containing protein [Paeniglutamicibacter kerguelensis]MBP2388026.1 IclR family pca regulon transcriptional regulator [Paeniglutamicibacter kerguelensis]
MSQDAGTTAAGGSTSVQSLARGLEVITSFDAEHPSMTLSEVAKRTGLSRATARRFLLTLQELGYVRGDGKFFELTSKVLQLGYSYLSSATLPQLMEPVLEDLSTAVHESASASVLDGRDILYIARVHTRSIMRVGISVGTRFPAVNTSMGRVLLAFQAPVVIDVLLAEGVHSATGLGIDNVADLRAELEKIRARGYAIVDQELEIGLRSVAVPVFNADGSIAAAMNVSMSVRQQAPVSAEEAAQAVLPALQRAACQVQEALAASR